MTPTPSRDEMLARLAELRAANEATTSWGAAVGARSEEIRNLERSLAVSASDGVQGSIPDGQQCNEQSAQGLSRAVAKFERDGKIAVLVSPGFGAGWSTWNDGEECVFDPEIVQAVLARDLVQAEAIAKRKYPEHYTGGVDGLIVVWVNKGDRFEIHEYDGSESLRVFGPTDGYVA